VTATLLNTKLFIPPPQKKVVYRPRLIDRLNESASRNLTLISAGAGFGKTTLLSEWVQQSKRPAAWVSLDQKDNDASRFWKYLIGAMQTIFPDFGDVTLSILNSSRPSQIELILTSLINEISMVSNRFTLILDDFHLITESDVNEGMIFLISNQPQQMHLIISSRANPPWPLARLRARGEMGELRAQDLRFTPKETAQFMNDVMKLGISTDAMTVLEGRTEGWIAGLQMAAISMRGRKNKTKFIQELTGSHRFILDYLVEEVLEQQPYEIQDFLLKTSILDRLYSPLCDAVTGGDDSQAILTLLEQSNLFLIPLDDERRWYRYHHLFANLLFTRLAQTQPDLLPVLRRKASEWHEQNGSLSEAVGYALAANDIDGVARLVTRNALVMIYHDELSTPVRWLDALPIEASHSRPWLCIAHAWALAQAGKLGAVEPLLQDAEKILSGSGDPAEKRRLVGHIAAINAYTAALGGEKSHAGKLARKALEYLPIGDLMVRGYTMTMLGTILRDSGDFMGAARASAEAMAISQAAGDSHLVADSLCDLAALQFHQGKLHKAAANCREALQIIDEYSRQSGRQFPVSGHSYIRLGALLREWNDLDAAMHYAQEGLEISKLWGQADLLVYGYSEMARILQAIGETDDALEAIRESERIASKISSWSETNVAAKQARLWLAQGDQDAASRWSQDSGLNIDDKINFQNVFRYITLARVLIAQKAFDKVVGLLVRLIDLVEAAGAMCYVVELLILQGIALQAQGEIGLAMAALKRALSLAEPEGYVRIFIDEGEAMEKLLRQATARGFAVGYVGKLLAALDEETIGSQRRSGVIPKFMVEPLSERELQVLRLLTTHLSSTDIAGELIISVNTVRSHIKHIYSKLNVHNRREAIIRAKELDLI
jgi:LuxR family maltose regulon positive regulatory protein